MIYKLNKTMVSHLYLLMTLYNILDMHSLNTKNMFRKCIIRQTPIQLVLLNSICRIVVCLSIKFKTHICPYKTSNDVPYRGRKYILQLLTVWEMNILYIPPRQSILAILYNILPFTKYANSEKTWLLRRVFIMSFSLF